MKILKLLIILTILLKSTISFSQYGKYNLSVTQTMIPSSGISVGDVVVITLTVKHNNYNSCDSWLNGITLSLGVGFDTATVQYISSPSVRWISANNANDMPVGVVGWGFDALSNGNPFSSWGKSGSGPYTYVLEAQVISIASVTDLDVNVFYSGDYDTGAYSGGSCGTINNPDGPYLLSPAIALPIKLSSFDGENQGKSNALSWTTETEINNDYFILEKSYDAISFEKMSVVYGSGNSISEQYYEAKDLNPQKLTYYRLTQVDFDGNSETFKTIALVNDNELNDEITLVNQVNTYGQVVNENYTGMVIEYYSDGTVIKRIKL